MLRRIIVGAIAAVAVVGFGNSAKAFQIGQTTDESPYTGTIQVPTSFSTPNADAASQNFLAKLVNPTTQNFNSFAQGNVATLPLNFGSAGTGTFLGKGIISTDPRYPNNTNSQLLAIGNRTSLIGTPGSTFDEVDFSNPIGALGFLVSVPEGHTASPTALELTKLDGTTEQIEIDINGQDKFSSVHYIDVVAENLSERFNKIRFIGESTRIQPFALSNITAASLDQVKDSKPVPEPTSVFGSLSAIAFGVVLRRKFKK